MNKSNKNFHRKLLEKEEFNPIYQEKYEKEVKEMIERKLTGFKRWIFILLTCYGIVSVITPIIIFIINEYIITEPVPTSIRVGLVICVLIGLFFTGFFGRIVKKGFFNMKSNLNTLAVFLGVTVFVIIGYLLFLVMQIPDPSFSGIPLTVGLVCLIVIATFTVMNGIYQSELRTQERLLRIEYKLAEVAEEKQK